jgi:rhamnosyltransferase
MHAIERLYPFAAQQAGYYAGWVLSDTFAKMEITNLNKMLGDFNRLFVWKFGPTTRYNHMDIIRKNISDPTGLSVIAKIKLIVRKMVGEKGYQRLRKLFNRQV